MKPPFVRDLEAGQIVTASFLVHSKEIREKKTGEPYLSLLLADRTGRIDAKMWDNVAEVIDEFGRDDFIKIKGIAQIHQNRPQLTIHKLRKMDDREVDFADYFPCSARDRAEMWAELRTHVAAVGSAHLRALLEALLDDPEIARRFQSAPAAKTIHHAYLGGLLEHVLNLCQLGRTVSAQYPGIDPDLMIAAAVLHDIGKIWELSYDRGFHYTTEGQLLGHMAIALRMISDKLRHLPDFPENLRTLLEHIVLSHHGSLEFGSPRLPQFREALLFHYLDDLDSKMEVMRAAVAADAQATDFFTSYVNSIERSVFKKELFLAGPPSAATSAATSPPAASAATAAAAPSSKPSHVKPAPSSDFASKLLGALKPE